MTEVSFSTQVKQEICQSLLSSDHELREKNRLGELKAEQDQSLFDPEFVLYFMLLAQGEFHVPEIKLVVGLEEVAALYMALFEEAFGLRPELRVRGKRHTMKTHNLDVYRRVTKTLQRLFRFDPVRGQLVVPRDQMELRAQRSALQGLFLVAGSMADPHKSYQMELQFRRRAVAQAGVKLFSTFDLRPLKVKRELYSLLYFKSRQEIRRVLRLFGAGLSVLEFENVQASKEMRGDVNRIVNCDEANTQRIVNASMRQLEAIERLDEAGILETLNPELQEAAQLRREHPEYSIREMAEASNPPVGKSGMNHRLRRLVRLAKDLDAKER